MHRDSAYRWRRLLPPLLVVGYLAGLVLLDRGTKAEFFPFFNWSLFPQTTAQRSDWALLIYSIDGQQLDPPRLYYDLKDTFDAARSGDSTLMKLVRRLGVAVQSGDEHSVIELQSVVEETFMREAQTVEYELVVIHYDPIVRLRSGAIDGIDFVQPFSKATSP